MKSPSETRRPSAVGLRPWHWLGAVLVIVLCAWLGMHLRQVGNREVEAAPQAVLSPNGTLPGRQARPPSGLAVSGDGSNLVDAIVPNGSGSSSAGDAGGSRCVGTMILGSVVHVDESPVVGAELVLSEPEWRVIDSVESTGANYGDTTAAARTDAEGAFQLCVSRPIGGNYEIRKWGRVILHAAQFAPRVVDFPIREGESVDLGKIVLSAPASNLVVAPLSAMDTIGSVRILRFNGLGAEWPSQDGSSGPLARYVCSLESAATDSTACLRDLPLGHYEVRIIAAGSGLFEEREVTIPTAGVDVVIRVGFRETAALDGVVEDEARRPIVGAEVIAAAYEAGLGGVESELSDGVDRGALGFWLASHYRGGDRDGSLSFLGRVRTGPDGRFRLALGEMAGDVAVGVCANGYEPTCYGVSHGKSDSRPTTLHGESGLEVAVYDDISGNAVTGAQVRGARAISCGSTTTSGWPSSAEVAATEPKDPGRPAVYQIRPIDPGSLVWISVEAAGYSPARTEIHVHPGMAQPIAVRLLRAASIQGTVVDRDGRPVSDASVAAAMLDEVGDSGAEQTRRTATDPTGAFSFSGLARGTWELRVLNGVGGQGSRKRVETLEADVRDVQLVMQKGASLRGRVYVADTGAPLVEVKVSLERLLTAGSANRVIVETRSLSDGSYELSDVPIGHFAAYVDDEWCMDILVESDAELHQDLVSSLRARRIVLEAPESSGPWTIHGRQPDHDDALRVGGSSRTTRGFEWLLLGNPVGTLAVWASSRSGAVTSVAEVSSSSSSDIVLVQQLQTAQVRVLPASTMGSAAAGEELYIRLRQEGGTATEWLRYGLGDWMDFEGVGPDEYKVELLEVDGEVLPCGFLPKSDDAIRRCSLELNSLSR